MIKAFCLVVLLSIVSISCLAAPTNTAFRVVTSTGVETIEPALGDYAALEYKATGSVAVPKAAVVLLEDANGPVVDRARGRRYRQIAQAEFKPAGKVLRARWPSGSEAADKIPAARFRIGALRLNQQIELSNYYVTVAPTAAAFTDAGVICPNDLDATRVGFRFNLSTSVKKCTLAIAGRSFSAATSAGQHVLKDAWNGRDANGKAAPDNIYPISISTLPPAGPELVISDLSVWKINGKKSERCRNASFDPSVGEKLEIRFRLSEPVKRLHATSAKMSATVIHKQSGGNIRLLAHNEDCKLDNNPADSVKPGLNRLVWDGKADDGTIYPGDYVIELVAADNAGQGCMTPWTGIKVKADFDENEADVDPKHPLRLSFDNEPTMIIGGCDTVRKIKWTQTAQGKVVASGVDESGDNGEFWFEIKRVLGPNSVSVVASRPGKPDMRDTFDFCANEIKGTVAGMEAIGGGREGILPVARFCPERGESLPIEFTSLIDDEAEIAITPVEICLPPAKHSRVFDWFFAPQNTGERNWHKVQISKGTNKVVWDGCGDNGQPLPDGVYDIKVVQSQHTQDGPLSPEEAGFEAQVILDRTNTPGLISGITASLRDCIATASWTTSVPTTCRMLCDAHQAPLIEASTQHSIAFRVANNEKTSFWIAAEDGAGHRELSAVQVIEDEAQWEQSDGDPSYAEDFDVKAVSPTTATIKWKTTGPVYTEVRYAKIGDTLTGLKWQSKRDPSATKTHSFTLTGLEPNSEYAVNVRSSVTGSFSDVLDWGYWPFHTKMTYPKVTIVSPKDGSVIEPGVIDVVVEAGDPVRKSTDNGLSKLDLQGEELVISMDQADHVPGTSKYVFHLDTANLHTGFYSLSAYAEDEFGNRTDSPNVEVIVKQRKP